MYEYDREKGVKVVRVVRSRGDAFSVGLKKDAAQVKRTRNRPGYLASPKDVAKFLDLKSCSLCPGKGSDEGRVDEGEADQEGCVHVRSALLAEATAPQYQNIPLGSPYAPREGPPCTVLPNPLPYERRFKPVPSLSRSPFRFNALAALHTSFPDLDQAVAEYALRNFRCGIDPVRGIPWRFRNVENPVHLRLKALAQVVCEKGLTWEGKARDWSLGAGKPTIGRPVFEDMRRSKLSA